MKKVLLFFSLMLAIAAQADVLGEYSFEGTLGDKIPVRLKFAVNGEEIAVGEIYYPKAKNPAPILVVGSPTNDEGWYYLKEYQSDGTITGTMLFQGKSPFAGFLVERGQVVARALSVESDEWQGR
jgi:hypothetical protein